MRYAALVLINVFPILAIKMQCGSTQSRRNYHKVASCATSGLKVVMQNVRSNLNECIHMARIYEGLSFSFRKQDSNQNDEKQSNCIIYACAELDEMFSIIREPGFDYYTQFADPLPWVNTTCIPQVGIVELIEHRANYSSAITKCRQHGGRLADVSTASKNLAFSKFLKGLPLNQRRVYVGLSKNNRTGNFETSNREPMWCFDFRAWAPGEPHKSKQKDKKRDCVTLSDDGTWHTVPCGKKLPFLCELIPNGPSRGANEDNESTDPCEKDIDVVYSYPVTDEFSTNYLFFFKTFILF